MEEYFCESDNVADKGIDLFIEDHNFSRRKNLSRLNDDIVSVFALFFTNKDNKKARQMLQGEESKVPRGQLCCIAFLGGGIFLATIVMEMFFIDHDKLHWDYYS